MGFGLKEIADSLKLGIKAENFYQLLEDKAVEKRTEINKLQRQLQQIEKSLYEVENEQEFTCSISIKTIPSRKVVSCRSVIHEFSEEGKLCGDLMEEFAKLNVQFAFPDYSLAIEHVVDLENSHIEAEIQRSVEKNYKDTEIVRFFDIPQILVASLTYQGGYSRISETNPYIAKWILENQYEICGPAFNIYHTSPENEENEDDFITEVCFPIKSRYHN